MRLLTQWLCGLTALGLLFLSSWIVLPPLNFFWLQLAVGAPEVSPILGGASMIVFAISLWVFRAPSRFLPRLLRVVLLVSLLLSSLPLLQQTMAVSRANRSMVNAFPSARLSGHRASGHHLSGQRASFSWSAFFFGFSSKGVRHQSQVPFVIADGFELAMDIYQPAISQPAEARVADVQAEGGASDHHPAVVMLYGGGWRTGDSSENEAFGQFLAARGYVVVAPEYRLTPDYQFPAQLEDVRTALSFVSEHADDYEIDRDRIGMVGWSAGAHLAMLAGFQTDNPVASTIKSIVNYYGPVDLTDGYANPPKPDPLDVRQVLIALLDGTPAERPDAYREASPITYVTSAAPSTLPPTLLIYGGRDHIVEAKYGKHLYDQLLQSGQTAVWVKIPWAEHAFDKIFSGVSNQLALHFVERFLAQTL
ncbi:MAG: alpha/beta hydrolase [Cyanobacteria bacterium J06648_10]